MGAPGYVVLVSLQLDVHELTIMGPEFRYIGVGEGQRWGHNSDSEEGRLVKQQYQKLA